jgi:eukaryotic-like serine/threonine-protein kinase
MSLSEISEVRNAEQASGDSRAPEVTSRSAPKPKDVASNVPEAEPELEWQREDLQIPDLKLLRRIGSGSYGEVWMARTITGALRAVKVVWREDFDHEKTFHREFEGIKQFEPISRGHRGLVNVLHVGWNEKKGFYYYVMELGDDAFHGAEIDVATYVPRTLSTDFKNHGRLNLDFCKETGLLLADALSYMHSYGLTHRDIKPSNIIFVNGMCKLADIGLVAAHGERSFVGTEGFVPPEGPGTFASDIFSLGKVLYEISSGKDRMEFPELPDDLAADEWVVWREWNDVICKACAHDVKDRYTNAVEFANDLHSVGVPKPEPLTKALVRGVTRLTAGALFAGTMLAMAKREIEWRYVIRTPDQHQTPEELAIAHLPNPGRMWMNRSGVKFAWRNDRHVADKPVTMELFNRYLEATSQPFEGDVVAVPAKVGKPDMAVVVPKSDARLFCQWMTRQDREARSLSEDYEYVWKPDPTVKRHEKARADWNSMRLEVAKVHFGQVDIRTDPPNATVTQGGEMLGVTPLALDRVRVGEVSLEVHLGGYQREILNGRVAEGKKLTIERKLKATGAVSFGSNWKNPLGMEFVPLGSVLMSATEVRKQDFAAFLRAIPVVVPHQADLGSDVEQPVTFVSRSDAERFCLWMTKQDRTKGLLEEGQVYRLPTDDEWSMAAGLPRERGESPSERNERIESMFPWGFTWPPPPGVGNLWDAEAVGKLPKKDGIDGFSDGYSAIAPAGSFPLEPQAEAHGLRDLAGNVWEWVADDFGGADARTARLGVLRGGSFRTKLRNELLSSHRRAVPLATKADDVGFRIVLSPVGTVAREGD